MTIKKLLLLAFVLSLSLSKAQTEKQLSVPFDEGKAIKEARKKGIPEGDIVGYTKAEYAKYMAKHYKQPEANHIHSDLKPHTIINLNTGKMVQTMMTTQCGNSDLNLNNYTNWTGDISNVNSSGFPQPFPINTYTAGLGINGNNGTPVLFNQDPCNAGTVSTSRQSICNMPIGAMTSNSALAFGNGYDPTCQNPGNSMFDLSMTPVNGINSLKLGDAYPQYTGQKISYQFIVNSSNALFTYQYAVVIADGGHGVGEQPGFSFQLRDPGGNPLGGVCGTYTIDATAATSDTSYTKTIAPCGTIVNPCYYRKWHTVTLDLSSQMGNPVSAEFETFDCIYSGHYAYAYISATCGNLTASVSGFCGGSGSVVMTAPPGFASYQWYGPPAGTILIPGATSSTYTAGGAVNGDVFSVDCITLQGCTTKLQVTVASTNIVASGNATSSCRGGANGTAAVTVVGGSQFNYTWTPSGLNTATIGGQPPGTYSVLVHDYSPANCPDTVVVVTIGSIPPVLTSTVAQLCGTQVSPALVSPTNGPWSWTFNGSTSVLATTQSYLPSFTVAPTEFFIVTYKDPATGCLDSLKTTFNVVNIGFTQSQTNPCNGGNNGSIALTPTGGNTFTAFDWSVNSISPPLNGTPNGGGPAMYDSLLAGGTYVVSINATGNPTCAFTTTITLVAGAIPPPATEALKGCATTNLSIPSFVVQGFSHSWYSGGISLGSSYPYITPNVTAGTVYTDTMRDYHGCIRIYKATLTVQSFNASITSPEGIHCHNDSTGKIKTTATTEVNGPLGTPYTFTWMYPAPYTSPAVVNAGTGTPQSSTESGLHAGTYTVVIQSGNCIATKTYTLVNPPALDTDTIFGYFCPKDSLALLIVEELGHPKYTWILNGVVVPSSVPWYDNDSLWVLTSQVNNYVVAYLSGNCKDTAKTLVVFPSYHALRPDTTVNIFTPNDDKINDYFFPFYSKGFTQYEVDKQLEIYEIFIYNRWGKLVFTSDHYTNPWTGKDQSGVPQDDGTFYYILKYKSNCATKADIVEKKGFVQLLR